MARLAVLTDRLPNDPSWKGAYIWQTILSLAESQHEVLVFTTQDPEHIEITHPRLTVARPAPSFTADRLARWAQALIGFQPEVIHTFALQPSALWPSLTVWPYLDAVAKVLKNCRRVSTMFERQDFQAGAAFHAGSDHWTMFSRETETQARTVFTGRTSVLPLDDLNIGAEDRSFESESGYTLIPAPVSEWTDSVRGLAQLSDYLETYPERQVWINGGWGECSLSERRLGWSQLMSVASRVRLIEAQSFSGFTQSLSGAGALWLEGVPRESWRFLLSAQAGQQLGKELLGATPSAVPLGSTANFLSRLYLS